MSVSAAKNTELLWFKDPEDFFLNTNNAIKFIPDARMSLNEQLNAAFRFALYFSIIVAIVRQDVRVLFFAVFVAIFTFLVGYYDDQKKQVKEGLLQQLNLSEDRRKQRCSLPTRDNPYMNVLMSDYTEFPNKPKACNINNKDIKRTVKQFSSEQVYQDVEDVFDRNMSDRQFFTNPVTTIPNNQAEFAHWLYNTGTTCKERSIACKAKY